MFSLEIIVREHYLTDNNPLICFHGADRWEHENKYEILTRSADLK